MKKLIGAFALGAVLACALLLMAQVTMNTVSYPASQATTTAGYYPSSTTTSGVFALTQSPVIRQCTEIWGGTGTSNALQSGDDAVADMGCTNETGKSWTITAIYCASDNASNTTTVTPTFGSAGTGTQIPSGSLQCGNSNAMASTTSFSNATIASGNGIDPGMGGTLTGTHIVLVFVYTQAN